MTTSSTPVSTATGFTWKSLIPILESAGNVALLATGLGAPFEPLVAGLENAVNPLLQSIGSGNTANQEMLAAWGTIVGTLTVLKQNTSLDPATLAKVGDYLTAAQNGLTQYMAAANGYNAALYTIT